MLLVEVLSSNFEVRDKRVKKTISLLAAAVVCLALTATTVNAQVIGDKPSTKTPSGDFKEQKKLQKKQAKKYAKMQKKQERRNQKDHKKAEKNYEKLHPSAS